MKLFGLGMAVAMIGVIVALPVAVRPLAAAIAAPLRLRGLPGDLARQNATRNPRRRGGGGVQERQRPGDDVRRCQPRTSGHTC